MAKIAGPVEGEERVVQVAVAIIRRGDQILICRRKPDAVLANLWEFPGGKIEPGETPSQCVIREAREELGIEIRPDEPLDPITHTYPHATIRLTPILCTHLSGHAQPIGCADFKWINPHDLPAHTFPPANASLIRGLIARLT
jgi:mutator protein MutT